SYGCWLQLNRLQKGVAHTRSQHEQRCTPDRGYRPANVHRPLQAPQFAFRMAAVLVRQLDSRVCSVQQMQPDVFYVLQESSPVLAPKSTPGSDAPEKRLYH